MLVFRHRPNDLEFVVAARGWAQCVAHGSFDLYVPASCSHALFVSPTFHPRRYERRFSETSRFFEPRFDEAAQLGGRMIRAVMEGANRT